MNKEKIAIVLAGLIATGALVKVAINTEQTKQEVFIASGKIKELEAEVRSIKSAMYDSGVHVKLSPRERECMIKNVFHETGVEPIEGKIAVAQVTLNRARHDTRWMDTVCGVVYQKAQFSWTLQKKKVKEQPKGKLWNDSVKAVEKFEKGIRVRGVENAHFYHTDYIKTPKWADKSKKVAVVGQHIFYSEDRKS